MKQFKESDREGEKSKQNPPSMWQKSPKKTPKVTEQTQYDSI